MGRHEGKIRAGFVYELPKLIASEDTVELRIPEGGSTGTSFHIHAEDGSQIEGSIVTDSGRIHASSDTFSGTDCTISFEVDALGLSAGDRISTEIIIRSNLSEFRMPVRAEITGKHEAEFDPEVRTLEDFAEVCRKNMREGFRLFTNPGFTSVLNGNNRQYLALYRGMSHNPVTYQHLEEFLVSTGRKGPVEITLDKQNKAVYHLDVSQKDTLYIYRNTWGYTRLEVEVTGSFLEVDKKVITGDDFIGKVFGLEYIVRRDRLGDGKSYGRIRIRSVHQTLDYTVEASVRDEAEIHPVTVRSRRISWLMRDFLNLQLHIIDYPEWMDSSSMTVASMLEDDPHDTWAVLYQAYLAYSREDNGKAMEILWPVKDGSIAADTAEQRGLYLYLAAHLGMLPEEERNILPTLRRYYRHNQSSYLLLKLIHNEENSDAFESAERMREYENCFNAGCTSPFLYLDAWNLLSGAEALLRRLSPFTVAVLGFGQRYCDISEGLIQRTAFLSDNEKTFNAPVFRILSKGYRKYPDDDILEAVCKLIIKGDPARPEYFPWYSLAVERDIRVTRLYEYYMETYHAPASEELPLPIRMYFVTNNTLGERKKALLFASIVLHKSEDETSYLNYARAMKEFALDALGRGRIDENYAVLYREFFSRPEDHDIAEKMTKVMFARKITVDDPQIRKVVVSQAALKAESAAVVRDGVAYPDVITDEGCILFEDVHHRRFATTIPYRQEKLFNEREIARYVLETGISSAGCELCICHEKAYQMEVTSPTIGAFRLAARDDAFTDEYRNIIRRKLLDYETEHPESLEAPDALPEEETGSYALCDKIGTISLLVRAGRLDEAFRIACGYGWEGVRPEYLKALADHEITRGESEDPGMLCSMCWYIFDHGAADNSILSYLCINYNGPVRNLERLWQKLQERGLESMRTEERILLLSVQTHQFPGRETEILTDYIRHKGRKETVNAYLAYAADYYFLGNRQTSGQIFIIMEGALQRGEINYTICKLALLKYYSEIGALNNARTELCAKLLAEMDEKGLRFEFYNRLPKQLIDEYQIEDMVFIEEQRSPESRVAIHYQLREQNGAESGWTVEPMRNMYNGIFSREFLLFYGETLTYYLSVTKDGRTENTDSYEISLTEVNTEGKTRYQLLNRMLAARDENDTHALNEALDIYLRQKTYVDRFLRLTE